MQGVGGPTLKIVGVGGGTGLPVLLEGLKTLADSGEEHLDLTAIVTASDSGGSSGLLRRALNMPAVGDIRNCLIALSGKDSLLAEVCSHRFHEASELDGHSAGNMLLSALYQISGSLAAAVELAAGLLNITGRVLPSTGLSTTLCAEYEDGVVVRGESSITRPKRIERVWLEPETPIPCSGVLKALREADAIVLGPGSLYTSIIPNLLVGGVADAIRRSKALRLYVCNLMTEPGETDGYSAGDHLVAIARYLPGASVDACVMNTSRVGTGVAERYSSSGSEMVNANKELSVELIEAPLLKAGEIKVRHDPAELARVVVSAARRLRGGNQGRRAAELEVTCAESLAISVPERCRAS